MPIGYAALRVRGASFVIVSIALVLIMLLVFQSWASFTGGSRGLVVPRPFPGMLRPEHHRVFFFLFAALLGLALLAWWLIDRSRFGLGLKAIREDEDKAESLGTPTFAYKLVVFVVSAGFTALAGGLYALWFGDLDPVFQFSILTGSYMVLMALLGGVRNLYGPLLGALVVGIALEYFKVEFGNTPLHLVATGLLLGLVVMFMPDGVLPAVGALVNRFRPQQSSIREMTAAELRDERTAGTPAVPMQRPPEAAGSTGSGSASDSAGAAGTAGSTRVGGPPGSSGADSASGNAGAGGAAAGSTASDSASGGAGSTGSAGSAASAGAGATAGSSASGSASSEAGAGAAAAGAGAARSTAKEDRA